MKRTILAGTAICALLAGCATYDLSLMPRGPGKMAYGTAKQIDKSVTISIDDRTYAGKFAYVQGGSFTLATAFSGGRAATGNATSISAVGNGNVLAQAPDGHNLRCVFSFSGWSQSGTGTCLTDDNRLYDLQIAQ